MAELETFEDFLREIHAQDYSGTDDNMPDAFDAWLSELDVNELIEYGEQAIKKILKNHA